jgi:hypothetical protein
VPQVVFAPSGDFQPGRHFPVSPPIGRTIWPTRMLVRFFCRR